MRKRVLLAAICIVLAAIFYLRSHPAREAVRAQQQVAPDFSLLQLNGQSLRLSDYRGKVVLLDFWATWCDPCREETPHLVELQNKYGGQGLQIIGVSMDDGPEPVREFYQHFQMNYPVVMGNAEVGKLYGGVLGLPIAFVLARDGRIYKKHIGSTSLSVFENDITELLHTK